jgi:acyl-ACP thioesterase
MNIYSKELTIPFVGVDQSNTLTIASTLEIFQEAAINHAEILGVGREAMKQSGQVWILSRLSVFMEHRPRFGETVTIRTWPRSFNKLFAIRDFDIQCLGKTAVRGRSAWLIVDLEKRRPLRPQLSMETLPVNEGINALPGLDPLGNDPPPSLSAREFVSGQPIPRRAGYSDIDYNGHVNNTRYIQWIQDLLDPDILIKAKQIRLDINYLSEVRYGENVSLFTAAVDEPYPNMATLPPNDNILCGQIPFPCSAGFAIEGRRSPAAAGDNAASLFRAELRT